MRLLSTFAFACALACGGASSPVADGGTELPSTCTPGTALQTVTSSAGTYSVSACASATPVRGTNAFLFLVTDVSTGMALEGATVAVQPWMPDMGHGSPATPTVTAGTGGLYEVTNCVFQMGGLWQLRTTIAGSGASDSAVVAFTID
jgi:hypothetical protein